jgi:hypothetical protein
MTLPFDQQPSTDTVYVLEHREVGGSVYVPVGLTTEDRTEAVRERDFHNSRRNSGHWRVIPWRRGTPLPDIPEAN